MTPIAQGETHNAAQAPQGVVLRAVLVALLLVPAAMAVPEADAPSIDSRIAEVWHTPDVPKPGSQWQGGIRLHEGHNVTQVLFQICRVGQACFAPPTAANTTDGDTWTFDTNQYREPVQGRPVQWGINQPHEGANEWQVGVQYFFVTDESGPGGEPIPHGDGDLPPDDCVTEECYVAWSATHYFVFTMPGVVPEEHAPAMPLVWLLVGLALAGRARNVAVKSRDAMQE